MANKFNNIKNGFERIILESVLNKESKSQDKWKEAKKVIKESKILKSLYLVYENVNKCDLKDKSTLELFIKENTSLFKDYSKKEILSECDKLNKILNLKESDDKDTLFDIIMESTKDSKISKLKEKSTLINEMVNDIHIKNNEIQEDCGCDEEKDEEKVELSLEECKDKLAQIAEKYSFLNEEEYALLNAFIANDDKAKADIFESLKLKNLNFIKRTLYEMEEKDEEIVNMLNETQNKINSMVYSSNTKIEDFVKLIDLNK